MMPRPHPRIAFFRARLPALSVVAVLAASPFASGQQLGEPPRAQFRGAVDRVLVDISVHDGDGNFVPGLTADDFVVYEEGREVEITFFALERFRDEVPWHEGTAVDPDMEQAPVLPRYLVVFIDGYNTPPNEWELVKFQLKKFFAEGMQPNDRVLMATLTPERRLLVAPDFTRDRGVLSRITDEIRTNPEIATRSRHNRRQLLDLLYSDLATGLNNDPAADTGTESTPTTLRRSASLANAFAGQRKQEVLYTLDSVTSLAAHLNTAFDVPGPKVMVMISSGVTQNPGSEYFYIVNSRLEQLQTQAREAGNNDNYDPIAFRSSSAETIEQYILRAVGRLNRLNYALYTIGARGTQGELVTNLDQQTRNNLSPSVQAIVNRDAQDGLRMLSSGTGGLAFDNSNNFGAAFDQIDRDTAVRYVLGYTPPERPEDVEPGKFYRIRVEVNVPGLKVRARRGYVDS